MKPLASALAIVSLLASTATAQMTHAEFVQAMQARDASLRVHRTLMQRIFGMNVSYGGVLVPPSKTRHVSVFSSRPPGQPFYNVSLNPVTGRAEGITLLSIHF